jgi:hypothetical protein
VGGKKRAQLAGLFLFDLLVVRCGCRFVKL